MQDKPFSQVKIGKEFWYDGKFWVKMGVGIGVSDSTIKPIDPDTIVKAR